MISAVVIEDDPIACMTLAGLLESEGFSVRCFSNTDDAYEFCSLCPPQVLISDWCVPGRIPPAVVAREVKKLSGSSRIIFVSGLPSQDVEDEIGSLSGVECISKPINFDRLISDIKSSTSDYQSAPH